MKKERSAAKAGTVCIGLIAAAAIFCFFLCFRLNMEEPKLCKVYGAYPVDKHGQIGAGSSLEEGEILFPYLFCRTGTCNLEKISFPAFSGMGIEGVRDGVYEDTAKGYYMKDAWVFSGGAEPEKLTEPVTASRAEVAYEGKKERQEDIGKLVLYPKKMETGAIRSNGDGYEENGVLRRNMIAGERIRIQKISCLPYMDGFQVTVSGRTLEELKKHWFRKDDDMSFQVKIKRTLFTVENPALQITYETRKGEQKTQIISELGSWDNMQEDWAFADVRKYLKGNEVEQ